jgi:hypothetical protein
MVANQNQMIPAGAYHLNYDSTLWRSSWRQPGGSAGQWLVAGSGTYLPQLE